jgi:predicted pyridoxine 5'-phosphate oxidase superfamily flavin-nucleotide-binding protein
MIVGKLTDDMKKVLADHSLGYVASIAADGSPSLSPKATFLSYGDEKIMFGEMRSPTTVKNIATNPMVEVNFVDILARRGFRCKGLAIFHARGTAAFEDCLIEFAKVREASLLDMFNGIVVIDLKSASPLISPAYETGATEESLREAFKDIYAKL